jgi:hypothetical protein
LLEASSSISIFTNLNIVLMIVELSLLIPTLLLLVLGRREQTGRQKLLEQMTTTANVLTRQEYFYSVEATMQSAKSTIIASVTGSFPKTHEEEESLQRIVELISRLKKTEVQKICYLMPKSHSRLSIAYAYKAAGAEVKFHPGLLVSDLRYMVVDDSTTVIGLPRAAGENQPTKKGYTINSRVLSSMFAREFHSNWSQAVDYDRYAKEVVGEIKAHNHHASAKIISAELLIPEFEIARIFDSFNSTISQKEENKELQSMLSASSGPVMLR